MPDPQAVAQVDKAERTTFRGRALRHHGIAYGGLDASGSRIAGGRWNPKESFPVLYLALDRETAIAELRRSARSQGLRPTDLIPRSLTLIQVELGRVLDLTHAESRAAIGIEVEDLLADDPHACQAIGDAAHYLGFEAIKAPSATGKGEVLAVFMDKQLAGSKLVPLSTEVLEELPG